MTNLDLAPEPVQQPQTNNFNPWGGGGGAPAPASDPFGAPADPWGAPSSQPPPQPASSSAWGDPAPVAAPVTNAAAADPWGSSAPSQAADPFGQASAFPPSNSSNGFGASPTDPFGAPQPATSTQPPPAATDPFGQPTGKYRINGHFLTHYKDGIDFKRSHRAIPFVRDNLLNHLSKHHYHSLK